MLLCFIVILFICVVVGVIKYSTAHSLKQEKDIKLSHTVFRISKQPKITRNIQA